MSHPTFNLVDEPWIPVAMRDGSNTELSLRDLFAQAHEAKGFNEPSPLTYVSVARLLLAIAHRALNGPESADAWVALWRKGRFDTEAFDEYLSQWRHRFDLFDPEKPFAQAPSSEFPATEKTKPLSKLALELANGNNATLFDHTTDQSESIIGPPEATRMLLAAMNFGFGEGGIYRDTTLVRFVSFLVQGTTLFDTLMLNLQIYPETSASIPYDKSAPDSPWWESDALLTETKDETLPHGLTDHLTRRCRKVQLRVNAYGQIEGMLYRPGIAFDASRENSDPFFGWRTSKDKAISPIRFRLGRALWRDSEALFQTAHASSVPEEATGISPRFLDNLSSIAIAIGDHGDLGEEIRPLPPLYLMALGVLPKSGQASVDLWRIEHLPLPVPLLNDRLSVNTLTEALSFADDVYRALTSAGRRLALSLLTEGDRSPDKTDVANQLSQLQLDERYWPRLELAFHEFLHGLDESTRDEALRDWMKEVLRLARRAYDDAAHVTGVDARSIRAQMMGLRVLHRDLAPRQERFAKQSNYVDGANAS